MTESAPPPLEWPQFTNDTQRLAWYRACIEAYADEWEGHVTQAKFTPSSAAELDALEQRLGCPLPPFLRRYHEEIGTLNLSENLCSVPRQKYASIEPLADAYPGIDELMDEDDPLEPLVDQLVAFGDYLGNGNLWCFHRETGEVWYFDHDTPPCLARLFPTVADYLDALMVKCLLEVHGQPDDEALLRQCLGDDVVHKWMY